MWHPIAFHAEMNGNIMYLYQALRQNDAADFVCAIVKEVNDHVSCNNWQLIKHSDGLGNAMQVGPHYQCHYQVKVMSESPWWKARSWSQLL